MESEEDGGGGGAAEEAHLRPVADEDQGLDLSRREAGRDGSGGGGALSGSVSGWRPTSLLPTACRWTGRLEYYWWYTRWGPRPGLNFRTGNARGWSATGMLLDCLLWCALLRRRLPGGCLRRRRPTHSSCCDLVCLLFRCFGRPFWELYLGLRMFNFKGSRTISYRIACLIYMRFN